jgi:hypothetical protein
VVQKQLTFQIQRKKTREEMSGDHAATRNIPKHSKRITFEDNYQKD